MSLVDKIHVLHIVSGDLWAGAEVQLFTLAKTQLNQPEMQVSVVVLNHGRLEQQLRNTGIHVIVLDEAALNAFQILHRLNNAIKTVKPDIIHTHRTKENILGSVAARLNGDIPSLRTAHGAPEHRPCWYQVPKRIISFLDWFSGRFLQRRIIAVSADLASMLQTEFPSTRVQIIENGVDLQLAAEVCARQDPASSGEHAPLRIGIAGRLVAVKRLDLFIQAARLFVDDHPELNASFHILGDGPLREDLESLSRNLKTDNRVCFEGHTDMIHNRLRQLDMLLMTSDHEGLPMVLLEAMTLHVPVIAHAVGGIPDLLDHGGCGILVNDHSPQGYARAIYHLAADREHRTTITANALKRVKTHYSAEANANAYRNTYKHLLFDNA